MRAPGTRFSATGETIKGEVMSTRNVIHYALSCSRPLAVRSKRFALAVIAPVFALSGCYVMPVGTAANGTPYYAYSPVPIAPAPRVVPYAPSAVPGGPMPAVIDVKLYPSNDLANQTGVLTGQVTNMMTG